jgi:hypothetical protein
MVQGVADCPCRGAATGQARQLLLEPGEQVLDQRPAPGLACGPSCLGRLAADLGLDSVEGGDAR